MLEPIDFYTNKGINFDRLKIDIDRRIYKIGWMISQRQKTYQRSHCPNKTISHMKTQTEYQLPQRSCHQTLLNSRKLTDSSNHTRQNSSICFGINTEYHLSFSNLGNTMMLGTQASIDGLIENLHSTTILSGRTQKENQFFIEETLNKNDQLQTKHIINEQAEWENQDSLEGSLTKKNIQKSRDQKIFNNKQSLRQSILIMKKSQSSKSGLCIQLYNVDNCQSRSISRIYDTSRQTPRSSDISNKCAQSKNQKMDQKQSNCRNPFQLNNESETSVYFYDVEKNSQKDKECHTGFLRGRTNITGYKTKKVLQKIKISSQTKDKMKKIVEDLIKSHRKQPNDNTARTNLLKRIQQKYKPKQN